jgi:hypothetical protein
MLTVAAHIGVENLNHARDCISLSFDNNPFPCFRVVCRL